MRSVCVQVRKYTAQASSSWWCCCLGHSKNLSDDDDDDRPKTKRDCLSTEGRRSANRVHRHVFCFCDLDLYIR